MTKQEYLDKYIFHGLTNLNDGFDAEGIHYFSEEDFLQVLRRVKEMKLGILGIEPWRNGEHYGVEVFESYTEDPTDPSWYDEAMNDFRMHGEPLSYAASYFFPVDHPEVTDEETVVEDGDFETIAVYDDYQSAAFASEKLEAGGIYCFIADANTASAWNLRHAVGGMKLRVKRGHIEHALKILSEQPEPLAVDYRIETANSIDCPKCQSNNTRREPSISRKAVFITLIFGAPLPLTKMNERFKCFYCGNEWQAE
jgi:hypothetical protein